MTVVIPGYEDWFPPMQMQIFEVIAVINPSYNTAVFIKQTALYLFIMAGAATLCLLSAGF